jgi:hypothetical protein
MAQQGSAEFGRIVIDRCWHRALLPPLTAPTDREDPSESAAGEACMTRRRGPGLHERYREQPEGHTAPLMVGRRHSVCWNQGVRCEKRCSSPIGWPPHPHRDPHSDRLDSSALATVVLRSTDVQHEASDRSSNGVMGPQSWPSPARHARFARSGLRRVLPVGGCSEGRQQRMAGAGTAYFPYRRYSMPRQWDYAPMQPIQSRCGSADSRGHSGH